MNLDQFIEKLNATPENIQFEETMAVIDSLYVFTETAFVNGDVDNKAGENSGSCQLLSFAQLQKLSKQQTLHCFGQYYRDVLESPSADSHQNIRQFMKRGWDEVSLSKHALALK